MASAQKRIELASIQLHHDIVKEITCPMWAGWLPKKRALGPIDQSKGQTNAWRAVIVACQWIYSLPVNKERELVLKIAWEIHSLYKLSPQGPQWIHPRKEVITFLFNVTKLLTESSLREEGLFWLTVEWSPVRHDKEGNTDRKVSVRM